MAWRGRMGRWGLWLAAVAIVAMGSVAEAVAGGRVALVIGNAAYQNVAPLANPRNDAEALARRLSEIGFDVTVGIDLDSMSARRMLAKFAALARQADVALVYYAGHGIELGGRNFLIPVDAMMQDEIEAKLETIDLDAVTEAVGQARELGLVLVDACRDNPFLAKMATGAGTRSLSRGLAPVTVDQPGLLVSFAAQPGQTAADGAGGNSPYASALLEVLHEPGLEVGFLFRKLGAKVREATNGTQVPMERMQLPDKEIFLVPAVAGPGVPPATEAAVPSPSAPRVPPAPVEDPLLVYLGALQSGSRPALEDFIRRYPDHPNAADARRMVQDMVEQEMWDAALARGDEAGYRAYLLGFPGGRYRADAEARLLALVPPMPIMPEQPAAPATSGDACFDLWYERNAIFDAAGFCFSTDKAKAYFDNTGCTTTAPRLGSAEKRRVEEIKSAEARLGC